MLVDLRATTSAAWRSAGTVHVEPYRAIERYSHVMHIVSGVHGELARRTDAFDLFAATFPAGTLVGAPKVRAMQIIDELEPTRPRPLWRHRWLLRRARRHGPGHHDPHARFHAAMNTATRRARASSPTALPETEHEEVLAKSAALARALELAEEGL